MERERLKMKEKKKEGINRKGQSLQKSQGWECISSFQSRSKEGLEMYSGGSRNLTAKVKKGDREFSEEQNED